MLVSLAAAAFAVAMYMGDVVLARGLAAAASGDEFQAAANFNTAFRLYPGNGRIMSEMGLTYIRAADRARRMKDSRAFAYHINRALSAFKRAAVAEPLEIEYQVYMANAYGGIGQYDKALKILTKVLDERPYLIPAHELAAEYLAAMNKKAEAIKHYEIILRVFPYSGEARAKMIDLQKGGGN